MTTDVQLKTRPLKPGFGVELLDVDLSRADGETVAGVVDAFHKHGAILLRGQSLDPTQLVDFIAAFGEPEDHTQTKFTLPGHPKVFILSNREVEGQPIGAHNDGVGWHTDYSYKAEPVMCTMLYAVEVPDEGSDTLLADQCAAWNELSPERQAELDGLMLHHSYQYFMSTREFGRQELSEELKAANPDVIHPLIRTHPADGRKALWVSTGTVKEVVGMPNPEGLQLIDELVEWVTQDRFVFRHKWQVGDILMWDNRCTLHTGTLYDDTKYFRIMHRLWVKGDKPF
ncbi:TauD/TfdA family dioxygenase [Phenylobacterium aquaticum]|uniref:TauD/TfdA dioxygenase family protein n=1 Tax=Phenylobacterium aquaticum TaxID=1763816 RepID=UPI0026ED39DD|nr:TauD/TfdA family dioxygenase [Phenylobacterium aquaticum]